MLSLIACLGMLLVSVAAVAGNRPVLVSLEEAASLLAISPRKLWQLQADGIVPSVKIDRSLRFRIQDLEAYAESLLEAKN